MKQLIILLIILLSVAPACAFEAKVIRVIDGDTYEFIGYMLNTTTRARCRMKLYNAPETKGEEKAQGLLAKEFLAKLIEGKRVFIDTFDKDKYGRWLCRTWLRDGTSVDDIMMEELKDYPGLYKYQWMNKKIN